MQKIADDSQFPVVQLMSDNTEHRHAFMLSKIVHSHVFYVVVWRKRRGAAALKS